MKDIVKLDSKTKDDIGNMYCFYIREGLSKNDAYIKLHPQHKDKDTQLISSLRYSFENSSYVKNKMKLLSMDTFLEFSSEHLIALRRQYEIGLGLHGGSLKTQADALHQFIGNTSNPYKQLDSDTEDKVVNEKKELLKSIQSIFDNIGIQTNKSETILDTEILEHNTNQSK